MVPAIDGNGLSRQIIATIRLQEDHQIDQLGETPVTAQRHLIRLCRADGRIWQGIEFFPGTFGWKRARGHGVQSDPLGAPFDRQ